MDGISKTTRKFLFIYYTNIEKAYNLSHGLLQIYNKQAVNDVAMLKMENWFKDVKMRSLSVLIR